jgi:lipoate-protein ligase A
VKWLRNAGAIGGNRDTSRGERLFYNARIDRRIVFEERMQGQFKTPGGKLVAVDFEIEDGVFRHVVIHGDFFLYPDDAFDYLAGAIEGAPANLPETELAARVHAALDGRAELIGSSPEAIATAISRGLAAGSSIAS